MKYLIHRIHRKIKGFLVLPIFHKASNKVFCMALVRGDLLDEVRGHWVPCLVKSDLWVCPPLMWSDIQHHFPQMMVRRLGLKIFACQRDKRNNANHFVILPQKAHVRTHCFVSGWLLAKAQTGSERAQS